MISAKTLTSQWNKSLDYESARLDEEVAEYIPGTSAYKMRKAVGDPTRTVGGQLKKAGAAIGGAFEKVSDFILKVSIQVHELAKRGLKAALIGAQKIFGSAAKFKEKHPNLYKAAIIVGITVAVFGLMSVLF